VEEVFRSQHICNSLTSDWVNICRKKDSTFLSGHEVLHRSPNLATKDLAMEGLMPLGRGDTMLVGGEEVVHVLFNHLNKHGMLPDIPCIHVPLEASVNIRCQIASQPVNLRQY